MSQYLNWILEVDMRTRNISIFNCSEISWNCWLLCTRLCIPTFLMISLLLNDKNFKCFVLHFGHVSNNSKNFDQNMDIPIRLGIWKKAKRGQIAMWLEKCIEFYTQSLKLISSKWNHCFGRFSEIRTWWCNVLNMHIAKHSDRSGCWLRISKH